MTKQELRIPAREVRVGDEIGFPCGWISVTGWLVDVGHSASGIVFTLKDGSCASYYLDDHITIRREVEPASQEVERLRAESEGLKVLLSSANDRATDYIKRLATIEGENEKLRNRLFVADAPDCCVDCGAVYDGGSNWRRGGRPYQHCCNPSEPQVGHCGLGGTHQHRAEVVEVGKLRAQVAALTARAETAERERDEARRALTLLDTRLLHASRVAEYAQHKRECEKSGEPWCSCGLAGLVTSADDYNERTCEELKRLLPAASRGKEE